MFELGTKEGWEDGPIDGCWLGIAVVGSEEGDVDGTSLCTSDGVSEGTLLGDRDGF